MASALSDVLVSGLARDVLGALYERENVRLDALAGDLAANSYAVLSALEDLQLLGLAHRERREQAGWLEGYDWVIDAGPAARMLGLAPLAAVGPRSRTSELGA